MVFKSSELGIAAYTPPAAGSGSCGVKNKDKGPTTVKDGGVQSDLRPKWGGNRMTSTDQSQLWHTPQINQSRQN